jgi:hypothetical protein
MKNALVALSLLLIASSIQAAVQYEFRQTSRSDMESNPPSDFSGRAILDGERSRVEILGGNAYPPGTYVISTNGSKTMTYVDPGMKQYFEVNNVSAASAMGSRKISVENSRHDVTKLDDHPVIAGQPTNHYRLTMDYDIIVSFGSIPLKQSVHSQIDKWTTVAFGDVNENFLSSGRLRTGNAQLDELMDIETTAIKGFSLRELSVITTRNSRAPVAGSQLQIATTHTLTKELIINSIQQATARPADFSVPAAFRKVEPGATDKKAPASTTLSLEPAGE